MGITSQSAPSSLIKPGVIASSSERPAAPYEGQMVYQKDTNALYIYDGANWVMLADADQPPSLQLIKTATVTNAADTGTTFDNIFDQSLFVSYRVVCNTITAHTNGSYPVLQFRYGGSTTYAPGSGYYGAFNAPVYSGSTNVIGSSNAASVKLARTCDNLGFSSFTYDFYIVPDGRVTFTGIFHDDYNAEFPAGGGLVAASKSNWSGFIMSMASGNISMTASVYGYRK